MIEQDELCREPRFGGFVYGTGPGWDDPAETYHEASKTYRVTAPALRGPAARAMDLADDEEALLGLAGPSRQGPSVALPPPEPLAMPLGAVLERRRSQRSFAARPLAPADVSTLLWAAYGRCERDAGRRPCPSGGALYPLEIWLVAEDVAGLSGLYHYDPYRHALTHIDRIDEPFVGLLARPDLVEDPAAWVVMSASFWQSRFKYGLRGYRHVLLEAGHAMQDLLLSATALGIGALPLSGFFDDEVDRMIGADGVNQSALYVAAVGAVDGDDG